MFIRIWKARVAPESYEEYRKFEKQMMVLFQDHEGFLGIFFRQNGELMTNGRSDECLQKGSFEQRHFRDSIRFFEELRFPGTVSSGPSSPNESE